MEVPVMAHFAELDAQNIVLRVIVVGNDMIMNDQGQESETVGIAFCQSLFGDDTRWMQTSYNGTFRKNYAGVGFTYDQTRDAFIAPMPEGDGWTLNEETCQWQNLELQAAKAATNIGVTRV
jgi:hypothetical protein